MEAPSATFLRLADELRGPFTREQLRLLAESGVITPETAGAAGAQGPWSPLRDRPDAAEIFPARREFQFKAAEFERVNPAVAAPHAAPHERLPPRSRGSAPAPNDVLDLVRDTARIQTGFDRPVDLTRRPSRRHRDYVISMLAANGFFVAAILLSRGNTVTLIFGLSGIVIASASLTWIMYGIMHRY